MDRRSFLIGTGAISSQLLIGCSDNKTRLTVEVLKNSLPAQVVDEFRRRKSNPDINIALVEQFEDVFKKLETWQKPTQPKNDLFGWFRRLQFRNSGNENKISTDLISLGDYWLRAAIEKKLIQPINVSKDQWSVLPSQYQELVTRNDKGFVDPQGKIWGAPYRWGNTVIVYRRDKFEEKKWAPIIDWADLWRLDLRNRISLLNHPREVIGLVLKKLNKSYNETDLKSVTQLESELTNLNKQVKFYGSTQYIEPLLMGDTLAAVGWSQDILPVLANYRDLAVVVPKSGTAKSVDLWVSPSGRQTQQELLAKWINFLWKPEIAKQIATRTRSHSPIISEGILDKSEFILPLPVEVEQQYINLFETKKKV